MESLEISSGSSMYPESFNPKISINSPKWFSESQRETVSYILSTSLEKYKRRKNNMRVELLLFALLRPGEF